MKWLSIDIETTGLNPLKDQILQFAAVIEDSLIPRPVDSLPYFQCYLGHRRIEGDPFAIAMNYKIIKQIANGNPTLVIHPQEFFHKFMDWLNGFELGSERITMGGKNVASFDRQFLKYLPSWNDKLFGHRTIDPTMCYWLPESDLKLPDMKTCAQRAGIEVDHDQLHDALYDARLVIQLVRSSSEFTYKQGLRIR